MRSVGTKTSCIVLGFIFSLTVFSSRAVRSDDRSEQLKGKLPPSNRAIVIDGSFVHNIGDLQMNITNWGFLGSLPKARYPMSESPSAQWPAGSGIEYLYAAGLWIGAKKNGVPSVSTGYPETEFYPPKDRVHTIYRAREGDLFGSHYPDQPDDDFDGSIDEDWLNGLDDDGDGMIDEDFAAFGAQMFSCWYSDDQPMASGIWPEHTPLGIRVRQETYQWAEEEYNDFVAVRYIIENKGNEFLEEVFIGIYADFDAGPRCQGSYHMDDQVGWFRGERCAPIGDEQIPIHLQVAYVYDDDGDDGKTPGYFGIVLVNYSQYYSYAKYAKPHLMPPRSSIYILSFQVFQSLRQYGDGGEPINDYERYDAISKWWKYDDNTEIANDYKVLITMGWWWLTPFDPPIILDIAYVCGKDFEDMLRNAAIAVVNFRGCWVDADKNPKTGVNGRESPVAGPVEDIYPDPCAEPDLKVDVPAGETLWVNMDCYKELRQMRECYHSINSDYRLFMTGIEGKEQHVPWVSSTAPPPPNMRAVPGHNKVTIFWDNYSEMVRDPVLQVDDFEGYQVWRAEDWHRPIGTSVLTGPEKELWQLLESRDLVNGVRPDREFKKPYSQGGWIYEPIRDIENRDQLIKMFEESVWYAPLETVPCPPGLQDKVCDTLEAIARYNLGLEGGRLYYQYIDNEVKDGLPYFYSVTAYDHKLSGKKPISTGRYSTPASNFVYVEPCSDAQNAEKFDGDEIYVVPNPVSSENMEPWRLGPNNEDPSGLKCEFRNLPQCRSTVRIYTVSGDLVQMLYHDGRDGNGTLKWDLLTRNGQDVTSGVYLFSVDPEDERFKRKIGKFIIIR